MRTLFSLLTVLSVLLSYGQKKDSIRITSNKLSGHPKDTLEMEERITTSGMYKAITKYEAYIQDGMVQVPYEPKNEAFLDSYMEVVYQKSRYTDTLNKIRMRLWKEPLRVYLYPSVPEEDAIALREFATKLDVLVDSLSIQFVNSADDSNYRVYHTNFKFTNEYEANLISTPASYYIYWDQYKINKGFLKINSQRISDTLVARKLLLWRFFQSLGHFSLLDRLPCSDYLSSCFNIEKELSPLDIEILQYHYSYGICKGTRITDFKEQHRRARESLLDNPSNRYYFAHPY